MIETPTRLKNRAANTESHISGRTRADSSRPRCWANFVISRMVSALRARPTCAICIVIPELLNQDLLVHVAGGLGLVVAQRVELVHAVEEAFERRARHHHVGCGE